MLSILNVGQAVRVRPSEPPRKGEGVAANRKKIMKELRILETSRHYALNRAGYTAGISMSNGNTLNKVTISDSKGEVVLKTCNRNLLEFACEIHAMLEEKHPQSEVPLKKN